MLEPKARKILVIKFRHIGDVLLTSPLISTLKHAHPGNRVSVAVKPGTEAMLEGHPDLDQLYILPARETTESKSHFFKRYLQWIWKLRKERFDVAINTTEGDRGILLSYLAGAKIRIGSLKKKNEKQWRKRIITHPVSTPSSFDHTVLMNLAHATIITTNHHNSVKLSFTTEETVSVKKLLISMGWEDRQTLIHIHPTSRWLFKCWNDEFMAEIIDWLMTEGHQVAITAAPIDVETQKINTILDHCNNKPINLSGRLTLKQLASLSHLSDLFFGVDSAPMHIAASQGTPVVALFGPSGSFNWGPWPNGWSTTKNPYPQRNGTQHTDLHTVVQKAWECTPCGQDGCDGTKQSRCLDELTPDNIIPHLQQRLSQIF